MIFVKVLEYLINAETSDCLFCFVCRYLPNNASTKVIFNEYELSKDKKYYQMIYSILSVI